MIEYLLTAILTLSDGTVIHGQSIDGWHPRSYASLEHCETVAERARMFAPPAGVSSIEWKCVAGASDV